MAIATPDEFRKRYPKFTNAGEQRIIAAIEQAKLFVDEGAFGVRYEIAVEIKAAALLESDKFGQVAPLNSKSETSEYGKRWEELCRMVPLKGMVL